MSTLETSMGGINPLGDMFKRWTDNRPPTPEQVKIQLSQGIRGKLDDIRARLAKIEPGEYELFTVPKPNELIVRMPPDLGRLIPQKEAKQSDWTVSINLPPKTIFGPRDRFYFWRWSLIDGSARPEIKVFENLDLYSSIRNFVHFGVLTPAEIPDLRELLKVTRHLKAAIDA